MTDIFVVAVSGGRDYANKAFIATTLNKIHRDKAITLLVQGGCRRKRNGVWVGADWLAAEWAHEREVNCLTVEAKWQKYHRQGQKKNPAGPIRNSEIAALKPHLWVFFPGGDGTADAERLAIKAGIRTLKITDSGVDEERNFAV